MKLRIFAEDKPAEKIFDYQLELADETIILSTALLSGAIALAGLSSAKILSFTITTSSSSISYINGKFKNKPTKACF